MYSPLSSILSSLIAIFLNVSLFFITLNWTPKQMRDYAKIIRLHCILDILIAIKIAASLNQPLVLNGTLYMISFSPVQQVFPELTKKLLYSYSWLILYMITIAPLDFIFRWLSVCKQITLNLWQLILWVLSILILTLIEATPTFFVMRFGYTNETQTETQALLNDLDFMDLENKPAFACVSTHHPYTIAILITMTITILFDTCVIAFTVRQIKKAMNKVQQRHSVNNSHNHIQRILSIQAVIPLIICIPIIFIVFIEFFPSLNSVIISDLSIILGIWYVPAKVFAVIMLVPAYRSAFLMPLHFVYLKMFRKSARIGGVNEKKSSSY